MKLQRNETIILNNGNVTIHCIGFEDNDKIRSNCALMVNDKAVYLITSASKDYKPTDETRLTLRKVIDNDCIVLRLKTFKGYK